jgi:uncharacterized protein
MKKVLLFSLVALGLFTIWFYSRHPLTTRVEIRGHTFNVDVAVTDREKVLGLGYRDHMDQDSGMIFPYDHKEQYHYWMKGMRFPLDIIWIRDNSIVDISKNVPVATAGAAMPEYFPSSPVNKVLELNAGVTDRLGIQIGDVVSIRN